MRAAKKILALVMVILMVFMGLPLPVGAEEVICRIGDVTYTVFSTAVSEVADGETIALLADCESGPITVDDKAFALDLMGHKLTIEPDEGNGLTVSGSGSAVEVTDTVGGGEFLIDAASGHGVYAHSGGQVTLANTTAKGSSSGVFVKDAGSRIELTGDVTGSSCGVRTENGGTAKVLGDVTVTGAGATGVSANDAGSAVFIGGDVALTGTGACGIYASYGAIAILQGVLSVPPETKYITTVYKVGEAVVTYHRAASSYDRQGGLPEGLLTRFGVDDGIYLVYCDETASNTVYVKKVIVPVCQIGTTPYESLDEALGDVDDGETIELLAACESGPMTIDDKDFTLDLMGQKLTIDYADEANGLTVSGSGSAVEVTDTVGEGAFLINAQYGHGVYVNGGAKATLAGTTAQGSRSGVFAEGEDSRIELTGNATGSNYGAHAGDGGEVTVTGDVAGGDAGAYAVDGTGGHSRVEVTGTATGSSFGSSGAKAENGGEVAVTGEAAGFAAAYASDDGSQVKVTGTATGDSGYGAFAADGGEVIVEGDVASVGGAVAYGAGSHVEITGNITASLEDESPIGVMVAEGGAVDVFENVTVSGSDAIGVMVMGGGSVSIGGDLTVSGADAIGVNLIDGGTVVIDGKLTAPEATYICLSTDSGTDFLKAGEGKPVTVAPYEDYLVYEDGVNFVYLSINAFAVCRIGTTPYLTLAAALAAVGAGETKTITLLTDIQDRSGIIIKGRTVTLDLDGYTLTVTKNAGHALEVGSGGKLLLIEDGGEFNVNSIGGNNNYGVYAHDGGQATVTSASANPDADSAGACAKGAGSYVKVTGDAVSGDGYVGDGAYATGGGAVFVGGDAKGINGASAEGATAKGVASRVEVTGDAIGRALFGAFAEEGGTVIVTGDAQGSAGARARGGNSLVQVAGDAIGSEDYGAQASGGGGILVGGNAVGGETGAYASGATEEGVSSWVEVTGDVVGAMDGEPGSACYGAFAEDGGAVTVGGDALGGTAGACASGTTEDGAGSRVEVTGNVIGLSAGAHAFGGGSVEIGGVTAGWETAIKAEGKGSTVFAADMVVIPMVESTESVCVVATGGGTVTIDGLVINMAGGAYIGLGGIERTIDTGVIGKTPYADYLIYTDASNTVRIKIYGVCMIGATIYETFEAALGEVKSGETIKLLQDIDYTVELPDRPGILITDKNITFDLNGRTLTVTSSAENTLEVGSGGVVNLIENGGEFNIINDAFDYGVYAHDGGQVTVTNATGVFLGACAQGTDEEGNPSRIVVNGSVEGTMSGVAASGGGIVEVMGDVRSSNCGIAVEVEGFVKVHGDVSVSRVDDNPYVMGVAIFGSDSTVFIGGNLTVTGTDTIGVLSANGGKTVIQGTINAPETGYIRLWMSDDSDLVEVSKTAGDGVPGKLPSDLLELLDLPDEDYLLYTDEISTVYVKIPVTSATISPIRVKFDKNPARQADVTTAITWNSAASVIDVKAGGASIGAANYGVSGNTLTIKKAYLAAKAVGELVLTVEFNKGDPAVLTIAISDTTPNRPFVPVTSIRGVPTAATAGVNLTLKGTVEPADATNQTIVWSMKDAGTTGASLSGSTLSTTTAGTVTVTATIVNGAGKSTDYTEDFLITVSDTTPFTGLPAAYTMQEGGRVTWDPQPPGGTWDWDESFFSATFNSPATFTALRAGVSTITYTFNGRSQSIIVTIHKAELPVTGQSSTLLWVLGVLAILCGCAAITLIVTMKKRKIKA